MKKIISVASIGLLALAIIGCSKKTKTNKPTSSRDNSTTTRTTVTTKKTTKKQTTTESKE